MRLSPGWSVAAAKFEREGDTENDEAVLYMADGEKCEASPVGDRSLPIQFFIILLVGVLAFSGYEIHWHAYQSGVKDGKATTATGKAGDGLLWATAGTGTITLTASTEYQKERVAQEAEQKRLKHLWEHRPHLASPTDAPPSDIIVGPYIYHVLYTSREALAAEDALARTEIEDREIWLDPTRAASLRGYLLHELMHTAYDLGTGGGRFHGSYDAEENLIEATAPGILEIMKDNPNLVAWFQKK